MQPFILISIFVFALIVVGVLVLIVFTMRKSNIASDLTDQESHPQGYWIGIGISIGAGFGVAMGLVLDNLALGIALGVGGGTAIGAALEQKNRGEIRSLTDQEQKMQRWGVALGLLVLLFLAGIFTFILVLRSR